MSSLNLETGKIEAENLSVSKKTLNQMNHIYEDDTKVDKTSQIYEVQILNQKEEVGELLLGVTTVFPGAVNNEFHMTAGHVHDNKVFAEYYFGISGRGLLMQVDSKGNTKVCDVSRNSVHYIKGDVAHRLINIGDEDLVVGACWHPNAGHNYDEVQFKWRIFKSDNELGYIIKKE